MYVEVSICFVKLKNNICFYHFSSFLELYSKIPLSMKMPNPECTYDVLNLHNFVNVVNFC